MNVDYRATTAEELFAAGERFDVVLALEVVEHVADVPTFLQTVADLVKPGGLVIAATHQPHAQGPWPCGRRRRVCVALATARHP